MTLLIACQGIETTHFEPQWLVPKNTIEESLRQKMSALDADIQGVHISTHKGEMNVLGVVFEMPDSYDLPPESIMQETAENVVAILRSQVADSLAISDMTFRLNKKGKEIYQSDFKF